VVERDGIRENFRFLTLEVTQQVERARRALGRSGPGLIHTLRRRDDYIDYLRTLVDKRCFEVLSGEEGVDRETRESIRSLDTIAINLERIADHAVSIVRQAQRLDDPGFLDRYDYDEFFDVVVEGLERVRPAHEELNPAEAMRIARSELDLDRLYERKFERILVEMEAGRGIPDLVTALFIFHYLERMGDCLQNVGEAILSSRVGERLKVYQYRNLRKTMAAVGQGEGDRAIRFEGIWGTRSGSRIGTVSDEGEAREGRDVVFKEGDPRKLRRERENIRRWQELSPDLPPRVVDFREDERDAAILMEYLEGETLYQLVVDGERDTVGRALDAVKRTLREVWDETRREEPVRPGFVGQLRNRLEDVYNVHPGFATPPQQIGGLEIPGFTELVEDAAGLDEQLEAPFRVFGHGDFNIDNVIFNPAEDRVHFIDLHRSGEMDYVQDVSVFLVSNFRVPAFDGDRRGLLEEVIRSVCDFARDYARERDDTTFEARLALGLARNFATSTRFEFQEELAQEMFRRSRYLLERLVEHRGEPWDRFGFPADVLAT
jgi:phosphate uptake regulator/aminoglycoside phosphotransferase (APT) family kinase protein